MWSVSHVSFHTSNGKDGHISVDSTRFVLLALSMCFSIWTALLGWVDTLYDQALIRQTQVQPGQYSTSPSPLLAQMI